MPRSSSVDPNDVDEEAELRGRGLRIRRLRAGLSQEELASRSQLSVRTIANIEAARVRPHSHSLLKLADALDLRDTERELFLGGSVGLTAGDEGGGARTDSRRERAGLGVAGGGWTAPVPRQLPRDVGDFTGRDDDLQHIAARLARIEPHCPPVVVISGQGGIGKTATAVRAAHAAADAFPDGQLFANLGGLGSTKDPAVVLGWFLRALGVVPGDVPADIAERTALFRSLVAQKRLLIVLDNAAGVDQVRPLLPGVGSSATIITSRVRLDAVEMAQTFDLPLFSTAESLALLTRLVGAHRVNAEPVAAHQVVDRCGHLPLAVRIAAARLAARGDLSLSIYARDLADEYNRLDRLKAGDLEVRASINLSYAALDPVDQTMLRRLAPVTPASFSAWLLLPLAHAGNVDPRAGACRLAERRLLDIVGTDPGREPRYRMHDLIRLFAAQRPPQDDESTRRAALERVLGLWLVVAETITDSLPTTSDIATIGDGPRWYPPRALVDELRRAPRDWFRAERVNLAAAVRAAAAHGLHGLAWQLAGAMASACLLYGDYDLLATTLATARQACQRAGDMIGEASTLAAMGRLKQELCELDKAHRLFERAYLRFHAAGDVRGQAFAAVFVADTLRALQQRNATADFGDAARWGALAQDLCQRLGDPAHIVNAGYVLGKIHLAQGQLESAEDCFRTVLALGQRSEKPVVRAHVLFQLGRIARRASRLAEATPAYREALNIAEDAGDLRSVAFIAYEVATTEAEQGNTENALSHATQAMHIYRDLHVQERLNQAHTLVTQLSAIRHRGVGR